MQTGMISVKTGIKIWESLARPILEYGGEIWPTTKKDVWKEAEILQYQSAKRILGCVQKSPNEAARGELGWWTLKARRTMIRLRFWWKLVNMDEERIVKRVYDSSRKQCVENKNKNKEDKIENWCTTTENYLIQLGMKDKWDKGTIEALGTKNEWRLAIKTAIQEQKENEWKEEINKKTMLQSWYGKIKNKLEREEYLNIKDPYARVLTTKLRTGRTS